MAARTAAPRSLSSSSSSGSDGPGDRDALFSISTPPDDDAMSVSDDGSGIFDAFDAFATPAARKSTDHRSGMRAALEPLDRRRTAEYVFYDLQDDGALRAGGKVALFERKTVGLLLNYAGIGVMYGALPSTLLPFLKYYLNMESYQVQAASAVVNFAWSLKTFGGLLSDSLPLGGYRRKSYMVLGWTLCSGALLFLSSLPLPEPYFEPGTRRSSRLVRNADAPHRGWMYVLSMALATFGYFFANVAADGMVVEVAQREPIRSRGETQTLAYATRSLFMIASDMFVGMALNSEAYGGDFSWSLAFNQVMLVLAICAVAPLLGSVFLLHEDKADTATRLPLRARCREMWRIAQSRAVWQVLAFELVAAFCLSFSSAAGVAVEANWAMVQPFHKALASLVSGLIYTAALYATKVFLLQSNWVHLFCASTLWIVTVKFVYVGCTVFAVVRNQFFWLYMQALVAPASALRFLLFSFPIVEIAEKGFEGTTYGLVVTFHNMAIPLGVSAYKSIDSYFALADDRVHADSVDVRWTVFYTYLVAWGVQLASIGTLFLLPRQRLEIQHLRFYGGHSRLAGAAVLLTLALVLLYAATTNVLSLFQSTQWFLWDPPGLVIAAFAWVVMAAALAALWVSISRWFGALSPAGLLLGLWFSALLGMCMWSHAVVMTTDPGAVPARLTGVSASSGDSNPQQQNDDDDKYDEGGDDAGEFEECEVEIPLAELESHEDDGSLLLFCDECAIYRPARAEHCSTCARCIILHDHHCPWVNNCVGIGNQKAFLLLLAYASATSAHAALFVGAQLALCVGPDGACGLGDGARPGKLGVWVLAGASVFGLFCSLMLAMELYSIQLEPLFSRIADEISCRRSSKSRSRLERHLSVVCGTDGFSALWLLPVAPRRSRRETEIVLGFRAEASSSA